MPRRPSCEDPFTADAEEGRASMTPLELVLKSLASGGAVVEPGGAEHEYVVRVMRGLALEPPVKLTIEPNVLQQLLENMGESGRTFFPEVPALEAARRLVSIDIEACLAADNEVSSITVTPDEVLVLRVGERPSGGDRHPRRRSQQP